jgi:lincosamide and streptogramin A transport system ATP-binding/permease protein
VPHTGEVRVGGGLIVSSVPQAADDLSGPLSAYLEARQLDQTLVKSLLRKLDFSRAQFDLPLERYSAGQKKKLLLAASLSRPAHLYAWDEPLNYIDVLSRVQVEDLLLTFAPTLLFVEHDSVFRAKVATRVVELD